MADSERQHYCLIVDLEEVLHLSSELVVSLLGDRNCQALSAVALWAVLVLGDHNYLDLVPASGLLGSV